MEEPSSPTDSSSLRQIASLGEEAEGNNKIMKARNVSLSCVTLGGAILDLGQMP